MHKVGDSMERLEFNDYEEFACEVADTFDDIRKNDDFDDIAIIAHYDEAKQIIREILCLGYDLNSIELKNPELGYDDVPYIISVCGIDSEHEVWCEPMIRDDGKYIEDESSVIYVLDNCSSEVLKHLDSECIFEVGIGDECSCDECECGCKKDIHVEADGDMHGFSVNHSGENGWGSYSFYSTDISLVNKEFKEVKELLNVCM